jgi:glucose uptake protein GlcU
MYGNRFGLTWTMACCLVGILTPIGLCPRDRVCACRLQKGDGSYGEIALTLSGFLQLGLSTVIFLLAATVAKYWALAPSIPKLLLTLALYSLGNLIMLRLVREFGMASAFSLSAVIQLVAVNVIALAYFSERLNALQSGGIVLAIVAVGLITLGPALTGGR